MLPSNVNITEALEQVEFNEESKNDLAKIVKGAEYFAMTINSNLYNCPEKTLAIRKIQEAVMWAREAVKGHQIRASARSLNGCEAAP